MHGYENPSMAAYPYYNYAGGYSAYGHPAYGGGHPGYHGHM